LIQFDPDAGGDGGPLLPIAGGGEEFKPFNRKVPEFRFWCVAGGVRRHLRVAYTSAVRRLCAQMGHEGTLAPSNALPRRAA